MKAGELDRLISLMQPQSPTDDGYTTKPGGFASAGDRWAKYIVQRVSGTFENLGREGKTPAIFEVRKDSLTSTVDATWQILFGGRTFEVTGVEDIGRNEGLRILTVAGD